MSHAPVFYNTYVSPLGPLYFVFAGKNLSGVSFTKPENVPFKKGLTPAGFIKEMSAFFKGSHKGFKQKTVFFGRYGI